MRLPVRLTDLIARVQLASRAGLAHYHAFRRNPMKLSGTSLFFATVVAAVISTILVAMFTSPLSYGEGDSALTFSLAKTWFYLAIAYTIFSFRWFEQVQADEIAVRLLFSRPTDIIDSGLVFAPLFIFTLRKLPTLVVQDEVPADPQRIFRDDGTPPPGMVPPVRIIFRDSITDDQAQRAFSDEYSVPDSVNPAVVHTFNADAPNDGLASRVTAEVATIVRFRIVNGIKFIESIGSIEEAKRQIEDEVVSVEQRILPKMSVAQANLNVSWISAILLSSLERRTLDWGIVFESKGATIKSITVHHGLNTAIGDAAEAHFKAQETVTAAGAEQVRLTKVGKGTAVAARELAQRTLEGRAKGLKKIADTIGVDGASAQAAEVARAVAEGGNTVVLGADGFSQLAGLAAAALGKPTKPAPASPGASTTPPAPAANPTPPATDGGTTP